MKNISVIIPIYNVEEYIEECLISVIKQTLKEIEIICVDDETPDNSMDIVEKYAKEDDRIVVLHKKNGGLSSARNAGLEVATGEYVYFLDSDDFLLEDTLEHLYREAKKDDLDTIFFDADSFFETEELAQKHKSYQEYYHRDSIYDEVVCGQKLFVKFVDNGDFRPSACLQMNKTSFLRDNNMKFKEGIIHEDYLFTLEHLLYSNRTKHIAERFYQRRMREGSIMTSRSAERGARGYFSSVFYILSKATGVIKDEEVMNAYMKRINGLYRDANNMIKSLSDEEYNSIEVRHNTLEEACFELFVWNNAKWLRDAEKRGENNVRREQLEKAKLKKQIKELKECNSFRIGRMVTFVPRKIKTAIKVLKRSGLSGVLGVIVKKISPEMYRKHFTKVSIIIPVYNGEKYLKECIESLKKQTMKDIEILCIDDKSTDSSLSILKKYAKKDKRIRVFEQEHLGAGHARNIGIANARGQYLLFLDCDDVFDKNLCQHTYNQALKYKAEIVLYATQRKDMQTGVVEPMGWVLRSNELPENEVFKGIDIPERLFQVTSNCPWSKMFSKKFILQTRLQFQNTKHANDVYFIRMAMAMANKMVVLNETLVTYRYNDGSNTQSLKHLAPLEFYKAFVAVKEKLEELNLFDAYKKSFINWILTESLFNYNTMQTDEAKKIVKDKMITEGFDYFGITDCKKEDIYVAKLYDDYVNFINN